MPTNLTPFPSALPRIEDLTRREFMSSALGAILLVACGDNDDDGPSGGATETRRIEHQYGVTEIIGTPERVVTVGWIEQDALLALGIVPVATTDWIGDAPGAIQAWAQDKVGDAPMPEVLDDNDGIQFERIAALQPDLILGLYVPMALSEDDYNRLSQIAPTVAPPKDTPEGGISWQDLTRTVGVAVGKAELADQLVREVEARFVKVRDEHPSFGGAVALNAYPPGDGTIQAYPPPDPGGRLLAELGFALPQTIVDLAAGAAWVDVSEERMDLFDIDLMLWLVDDYTMRDQLLANPVYAGLGVAREGRHVFLSYEEDADIAAATSMQTVLSLPFLLEQLVPRLEAALDGDPSTR